MKIRIFCFFYFCFPILKNKKRKQIYRISFLKILIKFLFKKTKSVSNKTLINALNLVLQQIPIWWRWCYWASPVSWTLHGLVTSQLGDKNTNLEVPEIGITIPLKMFLREYLGFDHGFLPAVAAAHAGWALLFVFVFAYGIKFLNFQRR